LSVSSTSLIVPANKKMYFIFNNTSGGFAVTVKVSGQTGILVPNGKKVILTCNGTDIVEAHTAIVGNATMGGTLGVTGATTLSAALTYGGITLSNAVTGTGNMVLSASPTLTGTLAAAAGTFSTTLGVTGTSTLARADATILTESTGLAWTAYTPTLTADTGTWGALTVTHARYRLLGKTLFVQFQLSATVSSGSPSEFRITYPGGASGQNSNFYGNATVSNNSGSSVLGIARQTASTYISFQQIGGGAWVGACQVLCGLTFELA